jgi:hypothetical protein
VPEDLTARAFSGHVGEAFRVHRGGSGPLEVELVSVEGEPEGRPFSVVFRGPADAPLSQGIHRMEHPKMGSLDIFLVPIGPDGEGFLYEAVFN